MEKIDCKKLFQPKQLSAILFTHTERNSKTPMMVLVIANITKHFPIKEIFISVHPGKIAILPNNCFSPNNWVKCQTNTRSILVTLFFRDSFYHGPQLHQENVLGRFSTSLKNIWDQELFQPKLLSSMRSTIKLFFWPKVLVESFRFTFKDLT